MKIDFIIQQPEGRSIEFKEKLPKKSDLNKTIVSFANDAGGVLILGIKDNPRKVVGIAEDDLVLLEEQISNIIFDGCAPVILPEISFQRIEEKYVIIVRIARGNNLPYYIKSKGVEEGAYIRVGSLNHLASREIIEELVRKRRNISFDSVPVYDKTVDEVDLDSFKKHFMDKTGEELTDIVLDKLNLTHKEHSKVYPTNALVLLSDDKLKQTLFPYSKIECALFKGTDPGNFIDQQAIDGPISLQADEAFKFLQKHIFKSSSYEGVYRQDRWEYPMVALREVVRNAVIHRDYSLLGKDIKIAIFDDKIEITSPGTLLPTVDMSDMESGQSDIRNKVLAPVFKKLGIIEQWGNGLKLISQDLSKYPNIEFRWTQPGMSFRVTFAKTNYDKPKGVENNSVSDAEHADDYGRLWTIADDLRTITDENERLRTIITNANERKRTQTNANERKRTITLEHEKVLMYLLDNKTINRSAAEELLKVKQTKAYELLKELVSMDLIVPKGIGRGTHYILKKE